LRLLFDAKHRHGTAVLKLPPRGMTCRIKPAWRPKGPSRPTPTPVQGGTCQSL